MLLLMPVLMGGSGIAMYLLRGQVDTKDKRVAIMDHGKIIAVFSVQYKELIKGDGTFGI